MNPEETAATAAPDAAPLPLEPALDPAVAPAVAPIDPALGPSMIPPETTGALDRAVDLLSAGGPVVALLLAMSVVALAIVLLKLWQFQRLGIGRERAAGRAVALYRQGHAREALAAVQGSANPVDRLLALAIKGRLQEQPGVLLREELARVGADLVETLRGQLRVLEVIASLAPLLGLFGTVLGMIDAFRQLEEAGSRVDPAILSGGIWVALLTTAVGLAVAIPVVALLNWLERRVERCARAMESRATSIFTADLDPSREEPQSHATGRPTEFAAAGE